MAIRVERPTTVIFQQRSDMLLSADAQAAAAKLFAVADGLIDTDGNHLFGDWCIADTDLGLMLNRLVANGDEVPAKLRRYVERQWGRPSVQAWVGLSARR